MDGKIISGKEVAEVKQTENNNDTLYVKYLTAGTSGDEETFRQGETLEVVDGVNSPLLVVGTDGSVLPTNVAVTNPDTGAVTFVESGALGYAAAVKVEEGVYFVNGFFVRNDESLIVVDGYNNTPSVKVGFKVSESLVTPEEDSTLYDNSFGSSNYSAPGAHRLKIDLVLAKKAADDFDDTDFIEVIRVRAGKVEREIRKDSQYNIIRDYMAKRTYDESGDYVLSPFSVQVKNSLNNNLGNNGVYQKGQFSYQGTLASDDLAQYVISPGKAYVKGYEVETISPTYLDCPKPRTTKTIEGAAIQYNTGRQVRVNGAYGVAEIGIGNTYIVSLRNRRIGSVRRTVDGGEIGVARVYDTSIDAGAYTRTLLNANQWDLSLYDIQTFSHITLNEPTTLTVPTFIKGKYSGATAFLQSAVSNSTSLVVYEKNGEFIQNEPFNFNGIEDSRVAVAITGYGLQDVKSIYGGPDLGNVGFARTFNADTIQEKTWIIGDAKIGPRDPASGISTVTATCLLYTSDAADE